jgi:hypothetical protein
MYESCYACDADRHGSNTDDQSHHRVLQRLALADPRHSMEASVMRAVPVGTECRRPDQKRSQDKEQETEDD